MKGGRMRARTTHFEHIYCPQLPQAHSKRVANTCFRSRKPISGWPRRLSQSPLGGASNFDLRKAGLKFTLGLSEDNTIVKVGLSQQLFHSWSKKVLGVENFVVLKFFASWGVQKLQKLWPLKSQASISSHASGIKSLHKSLPFPATRARSGLFCGCLVFHWLKESQDVWLGWACLTKKVHGPWHQGVCFDLPMIFCA
jgi:hypothetical protein